MNNRNIWFVRHAQSVYNQQKLFTGWHDPKLTLKGIDAANDLAKSFTTTTFDKIYCSPLKRASETAKIIAQDKKIIFDERLKERSYGDWSGKSKDEIRNEVGEEEFFNARRGWERRPPNGESLKDVSLRLESFIAELPLSGNILIVSHGNTIRAASVLFGVNTELNVSSYEIKVGTHLQVS
ncbi:MAG: 2,3-bisphosphoglycerate-dependent phosphoglycerate mutase [Gammaproteobacteria bacterium]|nr:2,3-bisphosphoglycerate-dependent phosphoglycerate mutase [Gammaproteobacteria bacterium]|tara:strand:+ start:258 stop:800 length:543 start_codon:yes stop_codon:yes gene_type:complete